jgi:hypothetical protein
MSASGRCALAGRTDIGAVLASAASTPAQRIAEFMR